MVCRNLKAGILTILFLSTSNLWADNDCSYEKTLTADLLVKAINNNCPDLMVTILKKEDEGDIFSAIANFADRMRIDMQMAIQSVYGKTDDDPESVEFKSKIEILKKLWGFLTNKCPDEKKGESACYARQSFENFIKGFQLDVKTAAAEEEGTAKYEKFKNSPQGLIQRACACDKFITGNQKIIARQKEIGRISGTVNMVILNSAGSNIVDLKKIKREVIKKYKLVTKKELKNYKCKNIEELGNPLLEGTGISE